MTDGTANASSPMRLLDASAVSLSGLCLLHCLALPIIAALLPRLGAWVEAEWVHWLFVALAVPISGFALLRSPCLRPSPVFVGVAAFGLLLLFVAAIGWPNHDWTRALTVIGGLLIASAHLGNWRRHTGCTLHARARIQPARLG